MSIDERYEDLSISLDDFVATVEIQRPPHNFFDFHLISQLADAFDELGENSDCRAIVLASQGKSFCAGANFGAGPTSGPYSGGAQSSGNTEFTEEGFKNTTGKLYAEGTRLFRSKKPIVGAIQGPAVGGGLGLSLVPDFRVVTPEARFAANFVKLGLHQGFGISVTLPRVIGERQANRMLLTGCRVSGLEAFEMGLADLMSDQRNLRADAVRLAKEIADNAPLAVMSVRGTLRDGLADAVAEATAHELKEQQWLRGTADAEEGIQAVAERRPGNFSSR